MQSQPSVAGQSNSQILPLSGHARKQQAGGTLPDGDKIVRRLGLLDLSQTAWTVGRSNQLDRFSGCKAEDPLDELDLTNNIPLGKPSDLSLSYRVHRFVASNRP